MEILREKKNGKLKVSEGNLLPLVNDTFTAGDVRNNENIGLTSMHVIWMR
jgi:peroxidase